jgi:hypothetical protein
MVYNKDNLVVTLGGVVQSEGYSPSTTIAIKNPRWFKNLTNVHGITEVTMLSSGREYFLRLQDTDGTFYNMIKTYPESDESPFSIIDVKDKTGTNTMQEEQCRLD